MTKYCGSVEKVIVALLISGPLIGGIVGAYVGNRNLWNGTTSLLLGLAAGLIAAFGILAMLVLIERFVNKTSD